LAILPQNTDNLSLFFNRLALLDASDREYNSQDRQHGADVFTIHCLTSIPAAAKTFVA
jgi:hypothetical protein